MLNRPSREPPKDWRRHRGDSHRECKQPLGHGLAPKFLWGGTRHQGGRRASRQAWSRVSGAIWFATDRV